MLVRAMAHNPNRIVINDINADIMNIYRNIQNDFEEFVAHLNILSGQYLPLNKEERRKFFFELRHQHAYEYTQWSPAVQSATLYFLMKTGFNGIYQINKNTNGRFGTPPGLVNQTTKVFDINVVKYWNHILQNVTIMSVDWRDCVKDIPDQDAFFFLDPPYRGCHTSYGQEFTDIDQEDLINFAKGLNSPVLLCNRDVGDRFFEERRGDLNIEYFDVTYTAGRRKRTDAGFEAKKAREVLLHNSTPSTLF